MILPLRDRNVATSGSAATAGFVTEIGSTQAERHAWELAIAMVARLLVATLTCGPNTEGALRLSAALIRNIEVEFISI